MEPERGHFWIRKHNDARAARTCCLCAVNRLNYQPYHLDQSVNSFNGYACIMTYYGIRNLSEEGFGK